MKPSLFNILLVFSLFSSALGHGYVESITVGGKTYPGNRPYGKGTTNTPIRQITTVNPITDVASPSMTCGIGAKINTAFLTVHVTAGSDITFHWVSGQGKWGHKTGPILTYLAKCDGDCKSFDPSKATFYKISQTGRKPNSMVWYQEDIENGASYTTKIPKGIPNGNYIIRNEIVALHFANRRDGAQFYPSCSQIRITGGSDAPNLVDVTSTKGAQFPGGYERNGPGIYVPDVYRSKSYTFPGPPVITFDKTARNRNPSSSSTSSPSKPTSSIKRVSSKPVLIVTTTTSSLKPSSTPPKHCIRRSSKLTSADRPAKRLASPEQKGNLSVMQERAVGL